ncbi:MAG: hypothetical protein DHS20C19_17040 [Acidimicrobiales bacterium]|nr:MAG: hypothetical protein DHS20C19_17040 [Acidimicrobiales bacterium]
MIRAIVLGLAVAVTLAGCGDDGPAATAEQNDAIARLIDAELSDSEHRCVLEGLIQTGIAPSAILTDEITADEDTELIGVTVGCIDDLTRIPAFVEAFVTAAAAEGTDMTQPEAICALEHLEADDPAAAVAECLGGEPTAPDDEDDEFSYGDDEVFDLLWDSCASGNNLVCDELAATAPVDSGYEAFGRTCAQRLPEGAISCFDELG